MGYLKLTSIVFVVSLLNSSCKVNKINEGIKEIESFSYYTKVEKHGLTTASVSTLFKKLEIENAQKEMVEGAPLSLFKDILSSSNNKKHVQKKLGTNMILSLIRIDGSIHKCLLNNNVIIDLTTYTEYWVKNSENSKRLAALITALN